MIDVCIVLSQPALCLPVVEGLLAQDFPLAQLNVSFFDNGSSDGSLATCEEVLSRYRSQFAALRVARSSTQLNAGAAANTALAAGSAPFALLLQSGATLRPSALSMLAEAARADDDAGAWEPRHTPYEHPKVYDPVTLETSWVTTAGVLLRRRAVDEAGGFDEQLPSAGADVGLSFRLREAGWLLRYCPRALLDCERLGPPRQALSTAPALSAKRAQLLLRARFGSWRDLGAGLRDHVALLGAVRPEAARPRRAAFVDLGALWRDVSRQRGRAPRRQARGFFGWDYELVRLGASHDIRVGTDLSPQPLVSVLVRTTGQQRLLRDALVTVAHQTYPNVELVVVEDGPPTLPAFLAAYDGRLRIIYHAFGENRGRSAAGNKAMELATGEYFTFLDDDDLLYADHVEQLVASAVRERAKVAYSYAFELPSIRSRADPHEVTERGAEGIFSEGEPKTRFAEPFSFSRLLQANFLPIQSVLFHRSLFEHCGGFDEALSYNEDWNLWVRYAIAARPFALVPKTTSLYRVPVDARERAERYAVMKRHEELIFAAQQSLPVSTTVGELLSIARGDPAKTSLERVLLARFPRAARPITWAAQLKRAPLRSDFPKALRKMRWRMVRR